MPRPVDDEVQRDPGVYLGRHDEHAFFTLQQHDEPRPLRGTTGERCLACIRLIGRCSRDCSSLRGTRLGRLWWGRLIWLRQQIIVVAGVVEAIDARYRAFSSRIEFLTTDVFELA